jgi:hypothetical protein
MPLNQATILAKALSLFETLRTGVMRHQRMKISALANDGMIASGRELVGITLEFSGKLQASTLKQQRIFQKNNLKSLKRKASVRDRYLTLTR